MNPKLILLVVSIGLVSRPVRGGSQIEQRNLQDGDIDGFSFFLPGGDDDDDGPLPTDAPTVADDSDVTIEINIARNCTEPLVALQDPTCVTPLTPFTIGIGSFGETCIIDAEHVPGTTHIITGLPICPIISEPITVADIPGLESNPADYIPGTIDDTTAAATGDPHLRTWRGHFFDFHGKCDLVLLHSDTFGKDGRGIDIHIRTEKFKNWSYIKNAVVKIGDESIELASKGMVYVNGKQMQDLRGTFAGYPMKHSKSKSGSTRIEIRLGEAFDLGQRGLLVLREFKDWVSVSILEGQEDLFSDSVGLMGHYHSGARFKRDGTTIVRDHNEFGQEWQVRQHEPRLFRTIEGPQYPDNKCELPDQVEAETRRGLLRGSFVTYEEAHKACSAIEVHHLAGCISDVMATSDIAMAEAGAI